MEFELKPLPYAVDALAPYLDAGTLCSEHLIDWDFAAANFEAEPPRAVTLAQHASEAQGL